MLNDRNKNKILEYAERGEWVKARGEIDRVLSMPAEEHAYYFFILKRAEIFIENNYKEKIRLQDVAKFVGMSQEYFSRIFKDYMHMNYKRYVNYVRVREAEKRLLSSKDSIRKISEEIGFEDDAYFTKVFRSFNGCTPAKFRSIYNFLIEKG